MADFNYEMERKKKSLNLRFKVRLVKFLVAYLKELNCIHYETIINEPAARS